MFWTSCKFIDIGFVSVNIWLISSQTKANFVDFEISVTSNNFHFSAIPLFRRQLKRFQHGSKIDKSMILFCLLILSASPFLRSLLSVQQIDPIPFISASRDASGRCEPKDESRRDAGSRHHQLGPLHRPLKDSRLHREGKSGWLCRHRRTEVGLFRPRVKLSWSFLEAFLRHVIKKVL